MTELFEHPEYKAVEADFRMYQDLYDGDHARMVSQEYLWAHEFEVATKDGNKYRKIREQRSRYSNLFEPIESTWVNLTLSDEITIPEETKKILGEWANDIDGEGHSVETFLREKIAPQYFRFGKAFVLADAPKEKALSEQDKQARGLRPFLTVLSALDVRDWQLQPAGKYRGKLKGIRTEYVANEVRKSLTDKPNQLAESIIRELSDNSGVKVTRYTAELKQGQKDWKSQEVSELSDWDEIPVTFICSEPWLKGVSQVVLRIFNLESALDTGLNAQAFQRVIVAGNISNDHKMAFNEYAVNFCPEGSTVTVIEPNNPAALQARIEQNVSLLPKVAFNRAHSLPMTSKESPGEDAQRKAKEETVALAKAAAEDLETIINQAVRLWAKFAGQDDFDPKIVVGKNITEEDVTEQITIFQAYSDAIMKVPTWYKQILKKTAAKQNLSELPKIEKEIDEMTLAKPEEKQPPSFRQQLLSRAANGAGIDSGEAQGERQAATGAS